MLELWLVDTLADAPAFEGLESQHGLLSADEIARAGSLMDAERRARWRCAHIALRAAIVRHMPMHAIAGVSFGTAPGGRPFLLAHELGFSLSHSGGFALVAVGDTVRLGIDLEPIVPRAMTSARRNAILDLGRALGADGAAGQIEDWAAASNAEDAALVQAWCRLEAFVKATGEGIGSLLTRAGIVGGKLPPTADVQETFKLFKKSSGLHVRDVDLSGLAPGYAAAVAVSQSNASHDMSSATVGGDGAREDPRPVPQRSLAARFLS